MACSTCDDYEFVPNKDDGGGLVDCPDCRAVDPRPLVWCPVHSCRVEEDGSCHRCTGEAARGIAAILEARAVDAAAAEAISVYVTEEKAVDG